MRFELLHCSYCFIVTVCLDGTVLNDKSKQVMRLGKMLDSCISNHLSNSTKQNSSLCADCKEDYMNLNNYYNAHKINNEFCMDVVDLVSSNEFV